MPLATRDESTRAAIAALGAAIDVKAVTAAWEAAPSAPEWKRAPVWIHGDLDPRNLLVENGRLSAVIDFGCLGVGDPACDVMVAWKVFPAHTRNIFRTALSVDEATWARARGWALSQALIALPYYTLETNPVLVREARRWLVEVLADRPPSRPYHSGRVRQAPIDQGAEMRASVHVHREGLCDLFGGYDACFAER